MYYLITWTYSIQPFKIHALFPAWRELCILCSYPAYMNPKIKTVLHLYTHEAGAASEVADFPTEKGRHFTGLSLFQSCYVKNAKTWTRNSAPSAWNSRQHQSWNCGNKHLSMVSHEINTTAVEETLHMRWEQSKEKGSKDSKNNVIAILPLSLII